MKHVCDLAYGQNAEKLNIALAVRCGAQAMLLRQCHRFGVHLIVDTSFGPRSQIIAQSDCEPKGDLWPRRKVAHGQNCCIFSAWHSQKMSETCARGGTNNFWGGICILRPAKINTVRRLQRQYCRALEREHCNTVTPVSLGGWSLGKVYGYSCPSV